jgi:hypothetical protein
MRTQNKLSAKAVEAAKFEGKPRKLFDGNGLFLHVQAGGRYWRLKYRHNGAEKLLALGVYPEVSLDEARKRRGAAKALLAEGRDPGALKKAEKAGRKPHAGGGEQVHALARVMQRRNLFLQTIAAINEMLMAGLPDRALMLRVCLELIRGDLFRMAWIGMVDEDGASGGRDRLCPGRSRPGGGSLRRLATGAGHDRHRNPHGRHGGQQRYRNKPAIRVVAGACARPG